MLLKFYAKHGHVVHWPGLKTKGQVHHYVGRRFHRHPDDVHAKKTGISGHHRGQPEPATVDSESDDAFHLVRYAQKGGLWPADEATAQHCGIQFTALQFDHATHEWMPAPVAEQPSEEVPAPAGALVGAPSASAELPADPGEEDANETTNAESAE